LSSSQDTYTREGSYVSQAARVANANFLNEVVAGTPPSIAITAAYLQCDNPTDDDYPLLQPALNTEEKQAVGDSVEVGEIYDLGYSDGAGAPKAHVIFGHNLYKSVDTVVIADIVGNVAEVATFAPVADVSGSLAGKYFEFDTIDFTAPKPLIKYYVWYKVTGVGADPAIVGRTGVEVDIANNDIILTIVTATKAALDAAVPVADCVFTADATKITATNQVAGAVDNAHDVDTGFTITTTVDGVSTITYSQSTTLPYFFTHNEQELSGDDIRFDLVGVTQIEHTIECEPSGKVEETREWLVANSVDGTDLARPRGPDGLPWTSAEHPFTRYKKNFTWGDLTFTFTYNGTPIPCRINGWKNKIMNTVDYKRDDGSDYSNAAYLKKRDHEITLTVIPTDETLRTISRTTLRNYTGDILLTVKMQRGSDTNDYIQIAHTKLRMIPFEQYIPGADYYTQFDIVFHAAPGNARTDTIKGYQSQQYFGVA